MRTDQWSRWTRWTIAGILMMGVLIAVQHWADQREWPTPMHELLVDSGLGLAIVAAQIVITGWCVILVLSMLQAVRREGKWEYDMPGLPETVEGRLRFILPKAGLLLIAWVF